MTKTNGREKSPPVVLRGDAEQTRRLIDSLEFKHKYTSGVLSFAPNEKITPKMEQAIMDRFEKVAFAGLEPDQYNILWVRHSHAGHHELHFVTPRVELSTGKSLNIKPPGKVTQDTFDDFRSEINARYGLADPDDPERAKNVATPNHELKIAAEAIRSGQKPPENIRTLLDDVLTERAAQGLIQSREDVLEHVKDLGFDVTRTGKNYITVQEPESGQRWRMKGPLYERDYEPSRTIEAAESARERDYSRPDEAAAERYAKRVDRHIEKRAEYHQGRYPKPEPKHELGHAQEQTAVAVRDRPEPLHRHLRRELGSDALLHDQSSELEPRGATRQNGLITATEGLDFRKGSERGVHHSGQEEEALSRGLPEQGRQVGHYGGEIDDEREHDGARKAFIDRIRALGEAIERAAERIAESAKQFTDTVRAHIKSEQRAETSSEQLERAGQQLEPASQHLERASAELGEVVQQEQALEQQQERQQQRLESRNRGPSLGL